MNPDDVHAVEHRLARIERSQRRLRGIALVLALLVAVLAVWQFIPGSSVVASRRFVLYDAASRERAELVTWADGTVVFRMNGEDQKARGLWRLYPDGVLSLRFTDQKGYGRIELRVEADGTPSLSFGGDDGHTHTWIGVAEDGGPALRTY